MRTVLGGNVRRQGQAANLAAEVEKIEFPLVGAGAATPPAGSTGTLWLKNPPPQIGHYDQNDVLDYSDSNVNNNATLLVNENVGPSKYQITKQ